MSTNVEEPEGADLDYAVAEVLGEYPKGPNVPCWLAAPYSTDWACGGPIIEREQITVAFDDGYSTPAEPWYSECGNSWATGPTPLIAAMRAFVASRQ